MTSMSDARKAALTVAICGSTGTGKSQLAVELAQHVGAHRAEIISADSMQMYRGMDVITNKATKEEMQGVPHHLMSVLDAQRGEECDIDRLHANAQLPIVVGGTSYYMQHLLLAGNLASEPGTKDVRGDEDVVSDDAVHGVVEMTGASLDDADLALLFRVARNEPCERPALDVWTLLRKLDPDMAARWHYRDTRKVLRSLRILLTTGKRPSDLYAEQRSGKLNGDTTIATTSPVDTLVLWVYSDLTTLRPRLDARVDGMLQRGLLEEILAMRAVAEQRELITGQPTDFTHGIFQTIGYKEFDAFLDYCGKQGISPTAAVDNGDAHCQKLLEEALSAMKLGTRQYARKQISWLRNKLAPALMHQSDGRAHLLVLDASDVSPTAWQTNVCQPARQALTAFMKGAPLPPSLGIPIPRPQGATETHTASMATPTPILASTERDHMLGYDECTICTHDAAPHMVMRAHWSSHVNSKAHKVAMRRKGLLPAPGPDTSAAAQAKRAARQQRREQ